MYTFDTQIGSAYNVTMAIAQQDKKIKELENTIGYSKTETDNLLDTKADADNVYTKTETDNLLDTKADADNVYTKTETDALLNEKTNLNEVYPVGSIYLTVNNTSPSELFGGQWEQIKDHFLLASGDTYINNSNGGSVNHSHNLSSSNVQAHIEVENNTAENIGYLWVDELQTTGWTTSTRVKFGGQPVGNARVTTYGAGVSGITETASNMPPYIVVNVWKRIY